jgi:hypothetical protein
LQPAQHASGDFVFTKVVWKRDGPLKRRNVGRTLLVKKDVVILLHRFPCFIKILIAKIEWKDTSKNPQQEVKTRAGLPPNLKLKSGIIARGVGTEVWSLVTHSPSLFGGVGLG